MLADCCWNATRDAPEVENRQKRKQGSNYVLQQSLLNEVFFVVAAICYDIKYLET